jgi:hypothetical protein
MLKFVLIFVSSAFLIGCASSSKAISEKSDLKMPFDMKLFDDKYFTALWLHWYDNVAWWTSDSVLAEKDSVKKLLGKSWFCYQIDSSWNAAYGGYDSIKQSFAPVLMYVVNNKAKVIKVPPKIDTSFANPLARALHVSYSNAMGFLGSILDSTGVKFNPYVRREADSSISVWFLPGFYENQCTYGVDISYRLTNTGDSIISKQINDIGLRYFKPDKKIGIVLNDLQNEMPSIGNIFFLIQFRNYFKYISINNKSSKSTMIFSKDKKDWFWVHYTK